MKIKHLAPGTYFQWKLGGCASIFEAVDPAAETYRIVAEFVGMVPMVLAHPGAETRLQKSRDVKPLRPWAVALLLAAIPKDWPERQPLAATPGVTAWGQDAVRPGELVTLKVVDLKTCGPLPDFIPVAPLAEEP